MHEVAMKIAAHAGGGVIIFCSAIFLGYG